VSTNFESGSMANTERGLNKTTRAVAIAI